MSRPFLPRRSTNPGALLSWLSMVLRSASDMLILAPPREKSTRRGDVHERPGKSFAPVTCGRPTCIRVGWSVSTVDVLLSL